MNDQFILFLILLVFITAESFHSFGRITSCKVLSKGTQIQSSTTTNLINPPLKQLTIRFNCDEIDSDEISELLFEVGTLSVSVEVESERPGILNDESKWGDLVKTNSWANAILRANFPSTFDSDGLVNILQSSYPDQNLNIQINDLQQIDWVSHVQQSWKPQKMSNLIVSFPWHQTSDYENDDDYNNHNNLHLILEGGAAFGTGDHPTTRLCCNWLSQSISASDKSSSLSILDYGCGSAILGLAALRYGADRAVGVDIDKDALLRKNSNNINNENIFIPVSQLLSSSQLFDLTVANILAPILIILAPTLYKLTKPGGKIALSGIVRPQAQSVIEVYQQYFENVIIENSEDDWVLITANK
eukprot:gene8645-11685_t